ncbi:hypothetical protein [Ehrlichia muris]|uniref:Uncharacterized protein n=1 Tax=Ehrlichia muris AS145 TaxID=1423892 RepID=V9R652_9RICK|nr:hypothetical protein [Ehrlichia muris]AHC39242.1 hypothetical protein EMUR_02395 [Ehrlichia muris AS145]
MIFHINGVNVDESQRLNRLVTCKDYVWFYRSICIGIITISNKLVFLRGEETPFYYKQEIIPYYIFFMKGKEEDTKVWNCILVKRSEVVQFITENLAIMNAEKTNNPLGIIAHIDDMLNYSYGEIICSGQGKMTLSKLKKDLKDICKNSDNIQLNSMTFPLTYWGKLIQNIVEIIPVQRGGYTRINS